MNIALIGFSGTGKTAIARLLARRLEKKLISTDDEISKKAKISIHAFVKMHGPDKFRDIESDVIEYVCEFDECIFDTGSGIVMRNENIINLKKNSLIILLTTDMTTIKNRLKQGKGRAMPKEMLIDTEHEARYKRAADYTIDTSRLSPEEACDLITHFVLMEMQ